MDPTMSPPQSVVTSSEQMVSWYDSYAGYCTPDRPELDRELVPILAELETLGPGNNHHPSTRKIYNWLVDPQRTGDDFTYVIGELGHGVSCLMEDRFTKHL